MAREPYTNAIKRYVPPWLQRTVGGRLIDALAQQADDLVDRMVDGVALRFPGALGTIDPEALALTGRERRIRRGPAEDDTTYARRIKGWWDAHRTRGGPYALLTQLRAFFLDWLPVKMDVLYHSGTIRKMDTAGVITRTSVTWDADGTDSWARFWVLYYVGALIPRTGDYLVTQAGDFLITQAGDFLITDEDIAPDALTPDEQEVFLAIPREWSAAHIDKIYVVLIWGLRRLWNYPQPVPTWSAWGASGALWGEPPVVLEITE